jgi:hypothetical protein
MQRKSVVYEMFPLIEFSSKLDKFSAEDLHVILLSNHSM